MSHTAVQEAQTTPKKWTPRWTGPHVIKEAAGENHYIFLHNTSANKIKAHVNRLCRFNPWSNEILSTSSDVDVDPKWQIGGRVEVGSLFAIPLKDNDCPFGIARLISVRKDGTLRFQWFSNEKDNIKGVFRPGWLDGDGRCYYEDRKRHRSHGAYEDTHSGTTRRHEGVILHGFNLTDTLHIPIPVLRAISQSGWIKWDFAP